MKFLALSNMDCAAIFAVFEVAGATLVSEQPIRPKAPNAEADCNK